MRRSKSQRKTHHRSTKKRLSHKQNKRTSCKGGSRKSKRRTRRRKQKGGDGGLKAPTNEKLYGEPLTEPTQNNNNNNSTYALPPPTATQNNQKKNTKLNNSNSEPPEYVKKMIQKARESVGRAHTLPSQNFPPEPPPPRRSKSLSNPENIETKFKEAKERADFMKKISFFRQQIEGILHGLAGIEKKNIPKNIPKKNEAKQFKQLKSDFSIYSYLISQLITTFSEFIKENFPEITDKNSFVDRFNKKDDYKVRSVIHEMRTFGNEKSNYKDCYEKLKEFFEVLENNYGVGNYSLFGIKITPDGLNNFQNLKTLMNM